MNLERENVIWFAGLFEGEGCLSNIKPKDRKATKWSMMLKMTDPDIIYKIQDLFGGNVYVKEHANPKHKTSYEWQICMSQAYPICAAIYPFMGERRKAKMEQFFKDFATRSADNSERIKKAWKEGKYETSKRFLKNR